MSISQRALEASNRGRTSQEFPPDIGDLDHLRERWRIAALKASEAKAIAERMTEGKRSAFEAIVLDLMALGEKQTHAERLAAVSDDWATYRETMIEARKAARDLEIAADNADREYWSLNNRQANDRAEKRMTGR